jgi:hypothetical protein
MPQSTKDSQGGKNHSNKKSRSSGAVSEKAAARKGSSGRSASSPTGPNKHGERKSTPH